MDEGPSPDSLIRRLVAGEPAAFESLFHHYRDRLCRYVAAYLGDWPAAEDVVGELFLELWRRRTRLADVRDLDAFLHTTARRDALDQLRHRAIERRWAASQAGSAGDRNQVFPI